LAAKFLQIASYIDKPRIVRNFRERSVLSSLRADIIAVKLPNGNTTKLSFGH
jgi:hypothetical protein